MGKRKKIVKNVNPNLPFLEDGKELKKDLGFSDAMAMVIGMVIGSGIFFKASTVLRSTQAPGLAVLAWIAGGIITIAAGLTMAEIATAIPKTGGLFVYLKELYGERWGFLLGWVQTFIYVPGAVAGLALYFTTQSQYFIPMGRTVQTILAIFIIVLVAGINIISTKFGGRIQVLFTIAKLIPIVVIIAIGFARGTAHEFTPMVSSASTAAGFGLAMLGTLWAYDGWISIGNIAGEMKNPSRDLPKSIIIGLSMVIVVYVLVNLAVFNILPADVIKASQKPVSDAAMKLLGKGGAAFISAGIMISIFGALNGYLMSGARIPFAMGKDKLLPYSKFFGKVSNSGTPVNSLIFEAALASVYVLTGSADKLTDLAIFVLWIFFVMGVAGIFILRSKHNNLERPYKVPLYPIIPIIGIVGGVFILISTLITSPSNSFYGIGITLLGLPVYQLIKKKYA